MRSTLTVTVADLSMLADQSVAVTSLIVGGVLSILLAIYGRRDDSYWDEIGTFFAFVIGLVIAVVVGLLAAFGVMDIGNNVIIIIMLILGILIGILNITKEEMIPMLLATIALIVVGGVFAPLKLALVGTILDNIVSLLATLMAPAAVIVAVKALVAVGFPKD